MLEPYAVILWGQELGMPRGWSYVVTYEPSSEDEETMRFVGYLSDDRRTPPSELLELLRSSYPDCDRIFIQVVPEIERMFL